MIEDGAVKEDFQVELLGVYPLKECIKREAELAKTSLFPKGLNGNAGVFIVQTDEIKERKSKSLTGRFIALEQRKRMSEAHKRNAFIRIP